MRASLSLLIAASLAGCSVEPPESCDPPEATWIDLDQDGFPADEDCNDEDPLIHPNAFEACDGIDNDCNGVVDDGYADVDGDGEPDCEREELCDGVDNDGDGAVDEGFADFDGDGTADCLDDACDITLDPSTAEVVIDEECVQPDVEVEDPWNVVIEWQWTDPESTTDGGFFFGHDGSAILPVIGRFSDTDGDGDVDEDDVPIVAVRTIEGVIGIVRGDTGETLLRITGLDGFSGVMLADVNADGATEVVTRDAESRVVAFDNTGARVWTSAAADTSGTYAEFTTADLDGDGMPEVLTGARAYEGDTGALFADYGVKPGIPYTLPAVGDIDLDGEQEVMIGNEVHSPDGTVEWTHDVRGNYGHWGAFVNIDSDPEGEVVVVGGGQIGIYEHDGTRIDLIRTDNAAQPGPICVADFDGDEVVEMAWASRSVLAMYELDGSVVWTQTVQDLSGVAGCSGYDVNGDGQYEILFADETHFRIFDGADGEILFAQADHSSGTLFEYPVIADVDADGSAEVAFVSNGHDDEWGTLTVLGHAGDGWMRAGATWPVHDFAVTNVLPDGSVPRDPDPSWSVHNVYRARPAVDTASANLQAEITDVCVSGCTDEVGVARVAVSVWNDGASPIETTVPVTVFALDGGVLTPLSTQTVAGVPAGTRLPSLDITVDIGTLGSDGLVVRVDDDGVETSTVTECNEADNEDDWPYVVCD